MFRVIVYLKKLNSVKKLSLRWGQIPFWRSVYRFNLIFTDGFLTLSACEKVSRT